MHRTAIVLFGLFLTGCPEPGRRTAEEEANLAKVREMAELFNQHATPAEYFDQYNSEDMVWTGFLSIPPYRASAPRDQVKVIVQRNHDLAPDRKMTVKSIWADGDTVIKEHEINSGRRDVHEIAVNRFRDGKVVETRTYSVVVPREGEPLHRTPQERAAAATVEEFVKAYNAQDEGWFERFFSDDIVWDHYTNSLGARKMDVGQLREGAESMAKLFPDREITIQRLHVDGNVVTMESSWKGTAAAGHPSLELGQQQTRQQLRTIELEDGQFARVSLYGWADTTKR